MCAVLLEGDGGRESYVFLSHTKGQGGSSICHHQSTNSQERKIAAYYSYETKGKYYFFILTQIRHLTVWDRLKIFVKNYIIKNYMLRGQFHIFHEMSKI